MHYAVTENANISILIFGDELAASHAAGKQRENRSRHIFNGRVVGSCGDVHGKYVIGP